ncbi:hypothetical protein [Bradyrhizobium jicamae]|uniref:hypothetical protein n=1 Tax=Bradyrhizobium jicamae TaxID=280332 RepID=UPI0018DDF383|nr:hypothetical protein [Bradyrhizobium jicamae]
MVTAELQRYPHVANADIVERANVPKVPDLVAYPQQTAENSSINHADAPQGVQRGFGIDLAPMGSAGGLRLTEASLPQICRDVTCR